MKSKRYTVWIVTGAVLLLAGIVTFFLRSVLYAGILSLIAAGAGSLILIHVLLETKAPPKLYRVLKWIFRPLLALILAAFLVVEGFVISAGISANRRGIPDDPDYSVVIIPGAGLIGKSDRPSLLYAIRLRKAAALYFAHPELTLVVCGGQGDDESVSEAEAGKNYLLSLGVPESAVSTETESLDTAENFANFTALFPGVRRCAVVTNDFHVFRCTLLAKRHGLDPVCFSSPTPKLFLSLNYYAREFISLAIYLVESNGYVIDTSNFHL